MTDEHLVIDTSETTPSYLWVCTNGRYLKLSRSAYHLLKIVEDGATYDEIAANMSERQGKLVTPDDVKAAHLTLTERIAKVEGREAHGAGGFWFRIPIIPERAVVVVARLLAGAFAPRVAACLGLGALLCLGLVLRQGVGLHFTASEYWIGYGWFLLSLMAHEFGHASACARYGARPNTIGVASYWIYPVFYSDVSAAWRLRRWQRVVVDLGGAYFQAVAAGVLALAYLASGWEPLKVAIMMIVYSCVFMLNPILKFDGYWVVADALGVTNLAQQPGRIARYVWARVRRIPPPTLPWSVRTTSVLAAYSVVAFGFWVYFVSILVPHVWVQLERLPALVTQLVAALWSPPHLPSLALLTALVTAMFTVMLGWLMLRRILAPLVKPVRSLLDRWFPARPLPVNPVETP